MGMTRSHPQGLSILVRRRGEVIKKDTFEKFKRMCTIIIQGTPVLSGELRHNYNIRYGLAPASKPYVRGGNGSSPLPAAAFNMVFNAKSLQPMVFGSSTPYVPTIEFGSWSNKAPNGMIRIAVGEVFGVR